VAELSKRLSQQELESYLWGAAVQLRGLVDAGDYKQFVFPLLFFNNGPLFPQDTDVSAFELFEQERPLRT
jgi:hypothetical protein